MLYGLNGCFPAPSPGPDGSLRVTQALYYDSVTGLVRPNAHSHMLLSSGHTMAVPPNFFVHPQTGRVMPIAGNVAYDPASSTLVYTIDSCTGKCIQIFNQKLGNHHEGEHMPHLHEI